MKSTRSITKAVLALTLITAILTPADAETPTSLYNFENSEPNTLDEALTLDPVTVSDFELSPTIPSTPEKIQHDVAVTSFDRPNRLYAFDDNRFTAYVGQFSRDRMFTYEGDPSPWQKGPALGAGLQLKPNITLITEYQQGWFGLEDYSSWMETSGEAIYMGIRFEFGTTLSD